MNRTDALSPVLAPIDSHRQHRGLQPHRLHFGEWPAQHDLVCDQLVHAAKLVPLLNHRQPVWPRAIIVDPQIRKKEINPADKCSSTGVNKRYVLGHI